MARDWRKPAAPRRLLLPVVGASTNVRDSDILAIARAIEAEVADRIREEERERAAKVCADVLDMKEENRAEVASREAKGTADELSRLRHWATVSTYNAGIRRCISAIREGGGKT